MHNYTIDFSCLFVPLRENFEKILAGVVLREMKKGKKKSWFPGNKHTEDQTKQLTFTAEWDSFIRSLFKKQCWAALKFVIPLIQ